MLMEIEQTFSWKFEDWIMKNTHFKELGVLGVDFCGLESKLKSVKVISMLEGLWL